MRVLIASKILQASAYRRKLDAIALQPGVDRLVVVTPPTWQEPGGRTVSLEPSQTSVPYELRIEPIRFNGSFHLFYWPTLGRVLREVRPDVVHLDEEPYNLATAHGSLIAQRGGARSLFFAWQNLLRRYPPPFSWLERGVYRRSAWAIAGSSEALSVLRSKGYRGRASVIPQFGVDPELFAPTDHRLQGPPTIGFIGRLVEEKGVLVLLEAVAQLGSDWRLLVIGTGPLEGRAHEQAARLGIADRVSWERAVASTDVPDRLRKLTLLVQPSLTRKHWKEQFGRALMEAMACGIPVVGSASGEIPNVIGDAGLVVREGDARVLSAAIARLLEDARLREDLGRRGRARVLERFTHECVAVHTVEAYRGALDQR